MVKLSTRERYELIVSLLEDGRREPKDVKGILEKRGMFVSIWLIYKAKERLSKTVQVRPRTFWH